MKPSKKILMVLFLAINSLTSYYSQASNTIITSNFLIQKEDTHKKTSQNYYNEAEAHEKKANKLYKRGTLFLVIGISAFAISSHLRKKKNNKKS